MSGALEQRVGAGLDAAVHPAVAAFARRLAEDAGAVVALFYGSNLRTGQLEGVLDFYLLLPGDQTERIWPRVSYYEWEHDGITLRAKVARMAFDTFERAARGESRDTTIWARFVQPSALVWLAEPQWRERTVAAVAAAAQTAARLAAAPAGQAAQSRAPGQGEHDFRRRRALCRVEDRAAHRGRRGGDAMARTPSDPGRARRAVAGLARAP